MSLYTGKLHSYLCHKHVPFVFKSMNIIDLNYTVPKKVGASVMPVLQTTDGRYLQDTHDIIMSMEKIFPSNPVLPSSESSPEKRFLSLLISAWVDEFWVPTAMHYRWNFPSSVEFFKSEAKRQLIGHAMANVIPNVVTNAVIEKVAGTLKSYLPSVGVRSNQIEVIEKWTNQTLGILDNHFAKYDFILGTDSPTLGDFALAGPLIAHLCRDPFPLQNLMPNYPNVLKFASRMTGSSWINSQEPNELPLRHSNRTSGSDIPSTIAPIVRCIFKEFIPMIGATQSKLLKLRDHPKFSIYGDHRGLPRSLEDIEFSVLDGTYSFCKSALPFNVWKFQQVIDEFQSLSLHNQALVLDWLRNQDIQHGLEVFSNYDFPKLTRSGLRVKFT